MKGPMEATCRPALRAYDGSYTDIRVLWRDIDFAGHPACGATAIGPAPAIKKYDTKVFPQGEFQLVVTDLAGRILVKSKTIDSRKAAVLMKQLSRGVFLVKWSNAGHQTGASMIIRH